MTRNENLVLYKRINNKQGGVCGRKKKLPTRGEHRGTTVVAVSHSLPLSLPLSSASRGLSSFPIIDSIRVLSSLPRSPHPSSGSVLSVGCNRRKGEGRQGRKDCLSFPPFFLSDHVVWEWNERDGRVRGWEHTLINYKPSALSLRPQLTQEPSSNQHAAANTK